MGVYQDHGSPAVHLEACYPLHRGDSFWLWAGWSVPTVPGLESVDHLFFQCSLGRYGVSSCTGVDHLIFLAGRQGSFVTEDQIGLE